MTLNEVLRPLITRRIVKMARDRLLNGTAFFAAGRVAKFPRPDIKLALLVVKDFNPHEVLTQDEEALLRGSSCGKLRGHKQRKELPHVL